MATTSGTINKTINVSDTLKRVYGVRGLPFPEAVKEQTGNPVASGFSGFDIKKSERSAKGSPLWGKNDLGAYVFLPARLGDYELPNPLVSIAGEKSIIETDVTEIGTVFEKVFIRPYDITIICTLINANNTYPEEQIIAFEKLYREGDLYTLKCALTDVFLQPKNNFILTSMALMDMQGIENTQVIQLNGRSNIDFELVIK